MTFTVRRAAPADWRELRALRLEMLADTPLAFLERLDDALAQPDGEWRLRAERTAESTATTLVAIADDGRWVGTMRVYLARDIGPMLVSVYVAPDFRGRRAGVTDALLDAIEDWSRERGATLTLDVNEVNDRARAAYAQRGFVETGHSKPYPLDPRQRELEMRKWL